MAKRHRKCTHDAMVCQVINRLHVADDDEAVKAAMLEAMLPEFRNTPEARKYVRAALAHHKCNQRLYNAVMRGL